MKFLVSSLIGLVLSVSVNAESLFLKAGCGFRPGNRRLEYRCGCLI